MARRSTGQGSILRGGISSRQAGRLEALGRQERAEERRRLHEQRRAEQTAERQRRLTALRAEVDGMVGEFAAAVLVCDPHPDHPGTAPGVLVCDPDRRVTLNRLWLEFRRWRREQGRERALSLAAEEYLLEPRHLVDSIRRLVSGDERLALRPINGRWWVIGVGVRESAGAVAPKGGE